MEIFVLKDFIDEFKHLEKLCNEIYGDHHGVTLYINNMEEKSWVYTRKIWQWQSDLDNLKRVCHIRNNLVHESGYDIDYDESDIQFMRDFCERILNRRDSLALLYEEEHHRERELAERIANEKRLIREQQLVEATKVITTQPTTTQPMVSQTVVDSKKNAVSGKNNYVKWLLLVLIIIIFISFPSIITNIIMLFGL
jgi:hypothetical protein